MSWIKTASKCALATGAILLSAGCTSKKDVAIAAKDDTIRRQEAALVSEQQSTVAANAQAASAAEQARRTAELNKQLAEQNSQVIDRSARQTAAQTATINEQTQRVVQLSGQVNELESFVKGLNGNGKTIVVTNPGQALQGDQIGGVHRDPGTGSIHIQVAGSVLFEAGHAELKPGCSDTLMRIAQTIKSQYPNNSIRIEGHTDSTPVVHSKDRYPDNMALSQARAAAVYDFMSRRGGIASSKMYTAGYGDRQPLVTPERTAGDRAKNRRVEIVILPNNLKVQKDRLAHGEGQARPYQTSTKAEK